MPSTFVDSYGELGPEPSNQDVVLTIPTHQSGDVALVVWVNSRDDYGDDVYTMSAGWTKRQMDREAVVAGFSVGQSGIYTKTLNGSETEATLIHNSGTTGLRGSFMVIFRGIDGDDPIDRIVMIEDNHGLLTDAQDETDYVTFAGGTGYTALDVLTMSCGSLVTVDAVSSGVVTEFTVDSATAVSGHLNNAVVAATGGTGNDDFTLTAATSNMNWNPNDSTPHPASITTTVDNGVLLLLTLLESAGYSVLGNPANVTGLAAGTPISNIVPMGVRHIGRVIATYKLDAGVAQTYTFVGSTNDYAHTLSTGRIKNQDETFYDDAPTTEGTYTQGSGYAVNDIITVTGGGRVQVDTIGGSGEVLTFSMGSVNALEYDTAEHVATDVLSQTGVVPSGGTGFSLTVDTDNLSADDSSFGGFRQYSILLKPAASEQLSMGGIIVTP